MTESSGQGPALDNLLTESRTFPPSAEFAAQANATAQLYADADDDREAFWAAQADHLHWDTRWSQVLDWAPEVLVLTCCGFDVARCQQEAALISNERHGKHRRCRLKPEALAAAADWLDFSRRFWSGSLERLDAHLKHPKEKKP